MNPIALWLASGESLYWGAGLLVGVMVISPVMRNRWLARLRNLLAWMGVAMVVLASAPFAWWVYGAIVGCFLGWFVAWNLPAVPMTCAKRVARGMSAAGLAACIGAIVTMELPYRVLCAVTGERADHLVVIGDSISAGIGGESVPWPGVFEKETGVRVVNLARPGIGTGEAVALAKKVGETDSLVLVEMGGNDLLANVPAEEFDREMTRLVTLLDRPGRTLVMFELPLLPHKIEYGRVQRRLAVEHHVVLIPKRFFIDVIGGAGATSDGLHLSGKGAERMAELVLRVVGPVATGGEK